MDMEHGPASPLDNDLFLTLRETIENDYPGAVTTPFMLSGLSDSRFFRSRGTPCYGIIPAHLSLMDLACIHGVNEKIAAQDVKDGTKLMYDIIVALCASV
jgi:acetylornithine deacetylase/succinyl-diaminopimelate desuccinylase-like protein